MNTQSKKSHNILYFLGKMILFLLLSLFLFVFIEMVLPSVRSTVKMLVLFLAVILLGCCLFIPRSPLVRVLSRKSAARVVVSILLAALSLFVPVMLIIYETSTVEYIPTETGFTDCKLLKDKTALVISPHQDDEANMASAMMESLLSAGSDVYIVFTTNGDYCDLADVRLQESADAMERIGIPAEHLFFLGYGDQWQGKFLYNHPMDEAVVSHNNHTSTYGSDIHQDFATLYRGAASTYTKRNELNDLKDCISLVHPDIIICADYDHHPSHRETSLLFEEAMGQLLREQPDWTPLVLKSLCYHSRWSAPHDFYNIPLKASHKPEDYMYLLGTPSYRWEDRVRIPMPEQFLTYKIMENEFRYIYDCYPSEFPVSHLPGAINSDEIFFERCTDSLLYDQTLSSSSGNAALLNDFKLFDSSDVTDYIFDGGCWIPADGDKTVRCDFSKPVAFNSVTLWDNPSPDANILGAELTLSDGSIIEIPALDPLGAKTEIRFSPKENIVWAELRLTDTEGEAGLTELELAQKENADAEFIKIIDENDNFIYNVPVHAGEELKLSVYSWPGLDKAEKLTAELTQLNGSYKEAFTEFSAEDFSVRIPGEGIYCLRVSSAQNPGLFDECIFITDKFENSHLSIYIEKVFFSCYMDIHKILSLLHIVNI